VQETHHIIYVIHAEALFESSIASSDVTWWRRWWQRRRF